MNVQRCQDKNPFFQNIGIAQKSFWHLIVSLQSNYNLLGDAWLTLIPHQHDISNHWPHVLMLWWDEGMSTICGLSVWLCIGGERFLRAVSDHNTADCRSNTFPRSTSKSSDSSSNLCNEEEINMHKQTFILSYISQEAGRKL